MNFFEEATLRLKQQLQLTQDKDVAAVLGMSARAWAGRKKNLSFPVTELYALVAQRPDLGIDPVYVMKGHTAQTEAELVKLQAASQVAQRTGLTGADAVRVQEGTYAALRGDGLSSDERVLVTSYRACDEPGRQHLIQAAALLAAGVHKPLEKTATTSVKGGVHVGGSVGSGAVLIGKTKGALNVGGKKGRSP